MMAGRIFLCKVYFLYFSEFCCLRRNYNAVAAEGGSWLEQSSQSVGPQCAATDPAADFRWHSLGCGGPAVASFICELPGMISQTHHNMGLIS